MGVEHTIKFYYNDFALRTQGFHGQEICLIEPSSKGKDIGTKNFFFFR